MNFEVTREELVEIIDRLTSLTDYTRSVEGFEEQIGREYARCFALLRQAERDLKRLALCHATGQIERVLHDDTAPSNGNGHNRPEMC